MSPRDMPFTSCLQALGHCWLLADDTRGDVDAVAKLPAVLSWKAAASLEPWILLSDEIDE